MSSRHAVCKSHSSKHHQTILHAATHLGVPPPFIAQLAELYNNDMTMLEISPDYSKPIRLAQDVCQGDPLSVHLSNTITGWCLVLEPELSVTIGDQNVNLGAFAELIVRTLKGLQFLHSDLAAEFWQCGLEISVRLDGKSSSLCMDVNGQCKMQMVNLRPNLTVNRDAVPVITITLTETYLGATAIAWEDSCRHANRLTNGLSNVSLAPLMPQQHLYILKIYLVPLLYQQLVLAPTTKKYMVWLDRKIHHATPAWLHLPHDTE